MIQPVFRYIFCAVAILTSAAFAFSADSQVEFASKMATLEKQYGGRIGVTVLDIGGASLLSYRNGERFPMCSTFKAVLAAAVLKRAETDKGFLDKKVQIGKSFIAHSPVTEKFAGAEMTVRELCGAIMSISDNTAANLLLAQVGGPAAVTAFARGAGGESFRLDRIEPELNTSVPKDERDTVTPSDMAQIFHALLFGNVLSKESAAQFESWLSSSVTGAKRIRAGVPADWRVGSKTGSGAYGTANETGVIYRPENTSLVVSIFYTREESGAPIRDDVVAAITRNIVENIN